MWAAPAFGQTCSQAATQGTAPSSWQTYCWLNFATYSDATARSAAGQNFSFALSDGATLSFNVKTSGSGTTSITAPSWTGAAVGNTAFLGIPGSPILYQTAAGVSTITISNILITPPAGVSAITAYAFVAADAESTDGAETLAFTTNGSAWQVLDQVNPITGSNYPTTTGAGTSTFTSNGAGLTGNVGAWIVGSNSPTTVTATLNGSGLQGAMFAVRFASLRLNKQIVGARVNAADQFKFDITSTGSGAILGTGTSTGTSNGPFTAAAISLASDIPLTIRETMAAGSVSTLAKYDSRLTCTNGTSGSSTSVPTNLASTSYSFGALQFGDAIQCTFTNTAFPHVTLLKQIGTGGRQFSSDQFTVSLSQGATTVASATTTGTNLTATTAQMQVVAGTAYTLNEVGVGATALAQYTTTLSCLNANGGATTTIALGGTLTPTAGSIYTCTITNTKRPTNATLTIVKSSTMVSDPVNVSTNPKAIPGAIIRYSLLVANSGSSAVDSNTLFLLDPLPSQISVGASSAPTFTNGTPTSGLTFSAATNVRYHTLAAAPTSFASCNLATPSLAYDPAIRYVCIQPTGAMAGSTGAGQPNFTVTFNAQIR